jgi:hypothetical protein
MPDLLAGLNPETPPVAVEAAPTETSVEADERAYEQSPESKEHFLEEAVETAPTSAVPVPAQTTRPAAPQDKGARIVDDVTLHVEKILEKDLGPLYATLPESAKPLFKKKGEEASDQIAGMLRSFRVEASRVIRLIRDWLLTIPNVNKFFLEQEAKLKTDGVLEYDAARREEAQKRP